jgi:hypothetical protein
MGLFENLQEPSAIDLHVRLQLADSLDHVASRAGPYLDTGPELFSAMAANIRAHRQEPGVVARYFDLVSAIGGDDMAAASALSGEMARLSAVKPEFAIAPYDEIVLGSDYERFTRLVFSEFASINPMAAPSAAEFEAARGNLEEALTLIAEVDGRIHREIQGLLSRIFVAVGSKAVGARTFAGATSFMVWGASFMNAGHYDTPAKAAELLVHEVTHALLSGMSCTEPLVNNSPEHGYSSPLRDEPRPMDGIYHATIVCGRLSDFYRNWAGSAAFDCPGAIRCQEAAETFAMRFRDGRSVIDAHGDLSAQGKQLLDECSEAIAVAT